LHLIVLPLPATQKRNSKREVNAQVVRLIESLKRQQKSVGLFQYIPSTILPVNCAIVWTQFLGSESIESGSRSDVFVSKTWGNLQLKKI
jgi:hypothetical protein